MPPSEAQTSDIGFCTCGSLSSCLVAWRAVLQFYLCQCMRVAKEEELQAHLADEKRTIIKALGSGLEGQVDGGRMPQAQRAWTFEQVALADAGKPSAFPADRNATIIIACSEGTSAEVTRLALEELGYTTACNAGSWSRLEKSMKKQPTMTRE
jgi:hypothetical protein